MQAISVQDLVEALESGDYAKGLGVLRYSNGHEDQFCCLGVAADKVGVEWQAIGPDTAKGYEFSYSGATCTYLLNEEFVTEYCRWLRDISDEDLPKGHDLPYSDLGLTVGQNTLSCINDRTSDFGLVIQTLKNFQARTGTP